MLEPWPPFPDGGNDLPDFGAVGNVRAIPVLVMILWVYYGMPQLVDISISVFWACVIALALSDNAF